MASKGLGESSMAKFAHPARGSCRTKKHGEQDGLNSDGHFSSPTRCSKGTGNHARSISRPGCPLNWRPASPNLPQIQRPTEAQDLEFRS